MGNILTLTNLQFFLPTAMFQNSNFVNSFPPRFFEMRIKACVLVRKIPRFLNMLCHKIFYNKPDFTTHNVFKFEIQFLVNSKEKPFASLHSA